MMTIDELIEHAIEFARQQLIGVPNAELLPIWMIQGPERTSVVGTPFHTEGSGNYKDMIAYAIRKLLEEEHAYSYSFMSEAWAATETRGNTIGLPPSKREDRREVVIVNAFSRDGKGKQVFYNTIRGDDGVITDLVKDKEADLMEQTEGRFYNLFDKE